MSAKIMRMMRKVHLTHEDLDLAAQACRALAVRYRIDAEREQNPVVRDSSVASAERFERLADRMTGFRESSS